MKIKYLLFGFLAAQGLYFWGGSGDASVLNKFIKSSVLGELLLARFSLKSRCKLSPTADAC